MKIVIDSEGNRLFWSEGDLHTTYGVIKKKEMKSGIVQSHLGKSFLVFDAGFFDKLQHVKRGPAIVLPKDIGLILAYTGIHTESKIVDAGTGTGVLAASLGHISHHVTSYESRKEFFELAKKNIIFLNVEVKLKNKDIYYGIDEKKLDMVILDLLEPWKVISHAQKALKPSGFFVCYLTNICQVMTLVDHLKGFYVERIVECIEREWIVEGVKVRPKHMMIGHTGFLLFSRRI